MCLGIADLEIQEKLRGEVWVRGVEKCVMDRQRNVGCRKIKANQGRP